ncbi:hypothetical protein Q31b_30590 [Novipirellula aureliae]|uniref:J domain-containing protein n=1 Tax=Novipirellula aureliae TaxID=2527966 RepID=A0A5C6DYA6_9BACT|nr:hypothetical protein [Novipirellula aureliae]TWU41608.1 hypothetical protein Q31b_30590 [Novipirellula aureliae]
MFDPLHKWLGIPADEQPPNHYRLLGISLFESDLDVIDAATDKHLAYLHHFANGEHGREAEQLANQLSRVRLQLIDPEQKAAYDAELRAQLTPSVEAESNHELDREGWYLRHSPDEIFGPFSLDDLIEAAEWGRIADQTELWHPKSTDSQWTFAFLFESISRHRPDPTTKQSDYPGSEDRGVTEPQTDTDQPVVIRTRKRRRSSSYGCLTLLIQLVIPALLFAIPIDWLATNKATFHINDGWNEQTGQFNGQTRPLNDRPLNSTEPNTSTK